MKQYKIDELNQIYQEGETADQEIFAEQRSNLLLVAGEHYAKKSSKYWNRIRDSKGLSEEQKLRLTKNHIQKITKAYVNNIVSHAPGTTIGPANSKEQQDIKSAQLNKAVWLDLKARHKMTKKVLQWANDYINIGECAVKIFWDPLKGNFRGYEQELDESGQPMVDESGQPLASKNAAFSGDFVFERVFGFNLLRSNEAKDWDTAKCIMIRKMASIEELKIAVGNDPDKMKFLEECKDETYLVFDASNGGYANSKDQTMLREYYFRPCAEYPNGYFYITTKAGILFEGELPFGKFPIVYAGFDEIQTSPRHRSIVKQLRPYQAEINRSASKIAEHQITLGDDKLLIQNGTKLTNGGQFPGIRAFQYTGMTPSILGGRSGDQYLAYMNSQIEEIYRVSNMVEDALEKPQGGDLMASLFYSMKNKKKFSLYAQKFEQFLVEVTELTLELAKQYYTEEMLVPAIGRAEYINIAEFKNSEKLCYQIKIEPQTEDLDTMMGKQLVLNHAIQYIGPQLQKDDIGKILRNMPFGNLDESFDDLTLDYDSAQNLILRLDRGEMVEPNQYDDHKYLIKRLVKRVRQADFEQLNPQIQQMYIQTIKVHEQLEAEQLEKIKAAQSEFIPSGGARVKVDFYVASPSNPNKVERATLPTEAVDWLIKQLASQGSSQEALTMMNQGAVAEISGMISQNEGMQLSGPKAPPQQF